MKIASVVPALTNKDTIALRTEPALTEEVFQIFAKEGYGDLRFSLDEGILLVKHSNVSKSLERRHIEEFEQMLNRAEQSIKEARTSAQNAHKHLLQGISQRTGLTVDEGAGSKAERYQEDVP